MSNNLFALINRLFTAILLVALLFACQNTPEGRSSGGLEFEQQVIN